MNKKIKKYFGTDGIRGRVNTSKMNAELALKIGMAAGSYFTRGNHKHHVLIGKDTRLSGYTIEPALVSGFLSMGMNVYLTGPLPTPGISALVTSMRCDIGIVISASHNSYEDNGIKIFGPDGIKLTDEAELTIENIMDNITSIKRIDSTKLGRAERIEDAGGRYIEYLKSTFSNKLKLDGIKVVIDCANGAAYKVAPKILWELGAEVISINIDPDGTNVNKKCGSTHPNHMIKTVLKHNADIGISLDGDADRCIFANEKGELIHGDQIIAMIATKWNNINKLNNSLVIGTILSNEGLKLYLNKNNINFIRTPVGDRYIFRKMKDENCNLGGEPSGHIILGDSAATGDGIRTAIEVLSIIQEYKKPLSKVSKVFNPLPQLTKDLNLVNGIDNKKLLSLINKELDQMQYKGKNNSRIIVRLSGTENKLRVMVEAKSLSLAEAIMKKSMLIINKFINK